MADADDAHPNDSASTTGKKDKNDGGKSGKTDPKTCVPEKPSGKDLPKGDMDKIIADMLNILQECVTKVDDLKVDSHSLVFMLLRIKETLDAYYNDYFCRLNSYLVQAEQITGEYFEYMACTLPHYGDYLQALLEVHCDPLEVGLDAPVKKDELTNLVQSVVDNYYATGMFIKSGRIINKDVYGAQSERVDIVEKVITPLPKWIEFQDKVANQLEQIREHAFKITAYIDFFKQGEMKKAPKIDLTPLTNPDSSKKKDKDKDQHVPPSNH